MILQVTPKKAPSHRPSSNKMFPHSADMNGGPPGCAVPVEIGCLPKHRGTVNSEVNGSWFHQCLVAHIVVSPYYCTLEMDQLYITLISRVITPFTPFIFGHLDGSIPTLSRQWRGHCYINDSCVCSWNLLGTPPNATPSQEIRHH